jgi:hypothetical protein
MWWFADVECDDDSVLNVIHMKTNLSYSILLETPPYGASEED